MRTHISLRVLRKQGLRFDLNPLPTSAEFEYYIDQRSCLFFWALPVIWDHTVLSATRHRWTP